MKEYRVKVIEKHSDYVWVTANNREEAMRLAPAYAECLYESLYDCEIVEENEISSTEKECLSGVSL